MNIERNTAGEEGVAVGCWSEGNELKKSDLRKRWLFVHNPGKATFLRKVVEPREEEEVVATYAAVHDLNCAENRQTCVWVAAKSFKWGAGKGRYMRRIGLKSSYPPQSPTSAIQVSNKESSQPVYIRFNAKATSVDKPQLGHIIN